jgi:hypothetical protein
MKINKTYSFILLLAIKSLLIAQTRTIGERYLVSGGWKIYYGRFIQNTRQELFKKYGNTEFLWSREDNCDDLTKTLRIYPAIMMG